MQRLTVSVVSLGALLMACAGSESGEPTHPSESVPAPTPVTSTAPPASTSSPAPRAEAPAPIAGSRLTPLGYRVLDATFDADRFHDRNLDIDCTASIADDGTVECVPEVAGYPVFLDASCSSRGVTFGGAMPARYARVIEGGGHLSVALGAARDLPVAYTKNDEGSCVEFAVSSVFLSDIVYDFTPAPAGTFITGVVSRNPIGSSAETRTIRFSDGTVSAPMDPTSWTGDLDRVLRGDARLAVSAHVTERGVGFGARLYDRELQHECMPLRLADEKEYCISTETSYAYGEVYRDAACAERVFVDRAVDVERRTGDTILVLRNTADFSPRPFVLGAEHDGPTFRRNAAGECTSWTATKHWDVAPLSSAGLVEVVKTSL